MLYAFVMKSEALFDLFEQVFDISDKLSELNRVPQHFGVDVPVTRAEIHLVASIALNEGRSVTELAQEKGVTKGAISQLLAKLESKGLIEKQVDPANTSRLLIRLTPKGHTANEAHDQVHEMIYTAFINEVGELDDEQFAFLQSFFSKCRTLLDKWMEERM
jgi:DNA-binding MarR family transcriptional regulator